MSFPAKTDYSGIARTGLEIVANEANASNQNLEIPGGTTGNILGSLQFGHVKNPHVEFKITADFSINGTGVTGFNKVALGRVHGTGPYALKAVHASSGAGEEPTFSVDLVQMPSGKKNARCIYELLKEDFSPARHASTYGAFTFEESDALSLQHADMDYDCELDPTTINGDPKAADAVKGKKIVSVTMWSDSDTEEPDVEIADGFVQTADWNCSGADGAMFVWTAKFEKYLVANDDPDEPSAQA